MYVVWVWVCGVHWMDDVVEIGGRSVAFLYEPPPGFADMKEKERERELERGEGGAEADGADAGATADAESHRSKPKSKPKPKSVKEQMEEKFPFLKNAPTAGAFTENTKLTFNPLGRVVRDVRCLRCGVFGHQSGDRECARRDDNPNDLFRQRIEDPMFATVYNRLPPEERARHVAQFRSQGKRPLHPREGPHAASLLAAEAEAEAQLTAQLQRGGAQPQRGGEGGGQPPPPAPVPPPAGLSTDAAASAEAQKRQKRLENIPPPAPLNKRLILKFQKGTACTRDTWHMTHT